jgi:hypothetical protein
MSLATAMAQNRMGDEGLSALPEGLRSDTTLRRLYVIARLDGDYFYW